MKQILTQFGFTDNEHQVYVGIYKSPLVTGSDLSRKLRMDKSSTYKAIQSLVDKCFLIASAGKNGIVYEAMNPESLKELYINQKLKLEYDKGLLDEFIQTIQTPAGVLRNINFVIEKGVDAFKIRMNESLACNEKVIREKWMYNSAFATPDYVRFADEFAHKRVDLGIFLKTMNANNDQVQNAFGGVLKDRKKKLKEVRLVPEEINDSNMLRIWDETVNILSFNEKEEFLVITIKDKYLASMMKNYFDFVWNRSEKADGV